MLKTLSPNAAPAFAQALSHEGEVLRRLSHQHIVRYRCAGTWGGTPVLVMERLHESLRDWLARHADAQGQTQVCEDQALRWARQVAQALHVLHRSGHKHLDLKPANLLLTAPDPQGRQTLKLADFGACLPLTNPLHPFVGTPGWAAPEQTRPAAEDAAGQPLFATSAASDWYALGQLLHRWLTGRLSPSSQADLARYQAHGLPGLVQHPLVHSLAADNALTWQCPLPDDTPRSTGTSSETVVSSTPSRPKGSVYRLANLLLNEAPARRMATASDWFGG